MAVGYFILNRNNLSALTHLETPSPHQPFNEREGWDEFYAYAAANIFDKGYGKEVGPEFHQRLSSYPENKPLIRGTVVVDNQPPEAVTKITLPEGFRHGLFSFRAVSRGVFSISVSDDRDSWETFDYFDSSERLIHTMPLKKEDSFGEAVYLKFLPKNESLEIYFDVFQYVSDLPNGVVDYGNRLLFGSDVDIDYNGKITVQPRVTYEEYKSRGNF